MPFEKIKALKKSAYLAQKNSYSPYSGYSIGAALLDSNGNIYAGCNVENSSYGGTVCAERVAIWKGISEGMKLPIVAMAIVSSSKQIWPPCGLCRQIMSEFCNSKTQIHYGNKLGKFKKTSFEKLFPESFTKNYLQSSPR